MVLDMRTNTYGDVLKIGTSVKWCDTEKEHTGSIRRFLPDNTALVLNGPYEAVYVDIDSLYL